MATKVLLFEKNVPAAGSLSSNLEQEGYSVLLAEDEAKVIEWASSGEPDLLILDISALGPEGLKVCESLQQEIERLPSLFILPKGGKLKEGGIKGDACLARPLDRKQLSSSIKRVLRLWGRKFLRVGRLTLNLETHRVFRGNKAYRLPPKQFDLLKAFMRHPGKVLSRKFLMKEVWGTDYLGDTRTLDVHIRWLREKIEENPSSPRYLHTVRKKGYRLEAPDEG